MDIGLSMYIHIHGKPGD